MLVDAVRRIATSQRELVIILDIARPIVSRDFGSSSHGKVAGVLDFDEGGSLIFEAQSNRGGSFIARFSLQDFHYIGRRYWLRNGLLPWFHFTSDAGKFYVCVETGPFIFGSEERTLELQASISKRSEQNGAG